MSTATTAGAREPIALIFPQSTETVQPSRHVEFTTTNTTSTTEHHGGAARADPSGPSVGLLDERRGAPSQPKPTNNAAGAAVNSRGSLTLTSVTWRPLCSSCSVVSLW